MDPLRSRPALKDRVRGQAARVARVLPGAAQVLLSARMPIVIDGQTLDPMVQLLRALRPEKLPLRSAPAAHSRARFRREVVSLTGRPTPVRAVRELTVEGGAGPLPARHYAPTDGAGAPLTVFFHGGGFVLGDLDTHDEVCRILCRASGHHVLSVDYRLAPEHPFPAAVEDAVAAFRWGARHARELGADPARVAVAGDSAGGTLSAVVSLLTAREAVRPAAQLLIYPATDRTREWPSDRLFDLGFLTLQDRDAFFELYAGGSPDPADPRISPLQAADLSGLPPALSVIAGFDILRDEGEAFARALAEAGTRSEVIREPRLCHGFANLAPVSRGCHRALVNVGRRWRAMV